MTFTYDDEGNFSTTLSQVRLTIQDTDSANAIFTDEELGFFIGNASTMRGAAALALEACASSAAKLAKMQKTLNWTSDTRTAAKDLRDQAQALRDADRDAPASGVIETAYNPFGREDIQRKEGERDGF